MTGYLTGRALQSAIVLLVMSFVIYALIGLMPGDPIDLMINSNPKMTSEDAARLRALYGIDRPILERYGHWLAAAFGGDFGFSRIHARPVMDILLPALGNTTLLLGVSFALSLAFGLWLGVLAAVRPYSRTDYAVNLLAFAGISVPPFWLALLLIIVFAVMLGLLPAGGVPMTSDAGLWESLRYAVLPVANLTIASIGGHTRFVRAAMIETLRQDFIRTARAKGIGERRVVYKHALRHALVPVTTIVALNFGALFSGALITETIFAYPGMGKLIFDAIMGSDFNLALVSLLFATLFTLAGNLLADLAYAALDPRIRYG